MATVYYLSWDKEENREVRQYFGRLTAGGSEDISATPKEWYRAVATVDDGLDEEEIWKCFQNGVPIDKNNSEKVSARRSYRNTQARSMSVGDVIEFDDGSICMAASFGFTDVSWGEPDIDF
jgi:hypothetical protein